MKKINCRLQKGKTALLSDGKTALELTFSDDEVAVCVYTDFKSVTVMPDAHKRLIKRTV